MKVQQKSPRSNKVRAKVQNSQPKAQKSQKDHLRLAKSMKVAKGL